MFELVQPGPGDLHCMRHLKLLNTAVCQCWKLVYCVLKQVLYYENNQQEQWSYHYCPLFSYNSSSQSVLQLASCQQKTPMWHIHQMKIGVEK